MKIRHDSSAKAFTTNRDRKQREKQRKERISNPEVIARDIPFNPMLMSLLVEEMRRQVLGSVTLFLNILACLAHDEPKPHDHTAGRRNVKGAAIGAKFLQFLASLLVQVATRGPPPADDATDPLQRLRSRVFCAADKLGSLLEAVALHTAEACSQRDLLTSCACLAAALVQESGQPEGCSEDHFTLTCRFLVTNGFDESNLSRLEDHVTLALPRHPHGYLHVIDDYSSNNCIGWGRSVTSSLGNLSLWHAKARSNQQPG
ncbi:unnamed protein product [Symbiodinium natans]|uniref:Uncharacterized protein n=1 Tax=Symbiodinium natans TaxID=878477 RepID=A0A812QU45_9DINO|nr:unnamed protein product [Symbiodinium natans]